MTTPAPGSLDAALLQLAEHSVSLADLRLAVAELTALVEGDEGGGIPYRPIPAPRWWLLEDDERQAATGRLASWVEAVYRPGYGHLADRLPQCWPQHPFCLYMLDWLSELHSVLYLQPRRTAATLAGQAEWHSRLLPAAADAMAEECSRCEHGRRP